MKVLAINPMRFQRTSNTRNHLSEMQDTFMEQSITINESRFKMSNYIKAYEGYLAAQTNLDTQQEDRKILTRILSKLPNLSEIWIVLGANWIGTREISESFGHLHGREFETSCEHLLPMLLRAHGDSSQLKDFCIDAVSPECLENLSKNNPWPRICDGSTEFSLNALSAAFSDSSKIAAYGLGTLTRLSISPVDYDGDYSASISRQYLRAIGNLLLSTPLLKELMLCGLTVKREDRIPMQDLATEMPPLLSLEELKLSSFEARDEESVVNMMAKYSKTVRKIYLLMLPFAIKDENTWPNAAKRVRERVSFEHLNYFNLYSNDLEVDVDVADYVLKKTNVNPVPANVSEEN